MQLPLWEPASAWKPPRISDLPSWDGAKRVGFDCETRDPDLKQLGCGALRDNSFLSGFSFSLEDGGDYYVPLRHQGGDNVEDTEQALCYLRDQAKHFDGDLVGAHLPYDLAYMGTESVAFPKATMRDVQVADPLINELHFAYSLKAIAERWNLPGKDDELMREAAQHYGVDMKGGMWRLPARFVGPYAEQDSRLPLQILRKQERMLEEQGLWKIWDLESAVLPVLMRMRQRGVRVSQDRLEEISRWSLEQEAEALAKVHHVTGVKIEVGDVWKAEPLAEAIAYLGIPVPKTAGGSPSITAEWLEGIDHEVADAIVWARKTNKLRTTFVQSVRTHMINGRIHATFNQMRRTTDEREGGDTKGAAYGRLSCESPNMQQQPARDEFAKMWRSIYLPEEGTTWASCDYSQQEPRWLVHFAELEELPKAALAAQKYRDDPKTDSHDMMTRLIHGAAVDTWDPKVYKKKRFDCKQIFLGKCYGQGGASTAMKIGLSTRWAVFGKRYGENTYFDTQEEAVKYARLHGTRAWRVAGEEAQVILDKFDAELPFVKKLAKACEKVAKKRGYIRTIGGRRCRFPVNDAGEYMWTHKTLNRLIQGSSADQVKTSLVEIDAAGYFLQLQIHDENTGSVESEKQANEMGEIMTNCLPGNIPFLVDVECGSSWGDSM